MGVKGVMKWKDVLMMSCLPVCPLAAETPVVGAGEGVVVFEVRDIPEGVPKEGHGKDAKKYGYRIPSLLTTKEGTVLAFCERRLGLHDHEKSFLHSRFVGCPCNQQTVANIYGTVKPILPQFVIIASPHLFTG